ncbi:DUF2480 family protein [Aquimarina spongiae]|uniref:DUF2480 family protein n=1 Tax=Aquimarina spongiae TaxID=570521 RepID=A0A1M6FE84_9FLAO|nr:DUF2480 family protein [Aquimarina spongiae]SHI95963.1 Protein of unknown function [Aquimarina spongiae]
MAEEIVNRVANNQKLVTVDLEDFYPEGKRILFDIKDWLFEGLLLREQDFRKQVADYDWSQHKDQYIALTCSTDAIIPGWAYLLLTSSLVPYAKKVAVGSLETLETILYNDIIAELDLSSYQDKFLIIKGCANKPVPEGAYIALIQKLQPVAKSVMYGEACSSVPLYKRK